MQTIGVYLITKNEEHNIRECLESVKWADEIVLVDDNSTDKTVEIAREYHCKIVPSHWRGYGKQKQFALEHLRTEWALNIDADEQVSPKLATEILYEINRGPLTIDGYEIPFEFFFLGQRMRFGGCGSEKHLRLFRRKKGKYDKTAIHETLAVEGAIGLLKNPVIHHSYQDETEYFQKFEEYTTLAAQEMHKAGKKAHWYKFLGFPWELFRRIILYGAFLDGVAGLKYAWYSSLYVLVKYKKLLKISRY